MTMVKNSKLNSNRNTHNKIAAVYARVSTTKQQSEGYSTKNQLDSAKKFTLENDLIIPQNLIFSEDKSASRSLNDVIDKTNIINSFNNRPKLKSLLQSAEYKEFSHLIVYKRDRLARSLEETIILDNLFKKLGITVHYTQAGENLNNDDDKINKLIHTILSSIAELEANILSTRVKSGNKLCVQKGLWPGGRAPFGYFRKVIDSDSPRRHSYLEKSDFESKIVTYIFSLYLKGYGYQRIAKIMTKEFCFYKWSKSKVEAIIKNETYTGRIVWDRRGGRRNSKLHTDRVLSPKRIENEIINQDIWKESVKLRAERSKNKNPHMLNTPFLLKDKLVCSNCGRIMRPKNPGTKRTNVYKCTSNKTERAVCNCIIPSAPLETKFLNELSKIINLEDTHYFYELYEEKFDAKIRAYKELISEITPKITACESTIKSIEKISAYEDSKIIQTALNNQHIVMSKLLEQYQSSHALYTEKVNSKKITNKDFSTNINNYINKFLNVSLDNTIDRDIVQINRRAFIIKYIDKVIVNYNKAKKSIEDINIEFIPYNEL